MTLVSPTDHWSVRLTIGQTHQKVLKYSHLVIITTQTLKIGQNDHWSVSLTTGQTHQKSLKMSVSSNNKQSNVEKWPKWHWSVLTDHWSDSPKVVDIYSPSNNNY